MNMKKFIKALAVSVLIFAGLYYGLPAILPAGEIADILKTKFDMNLCAIIGIGIGIIYLVSSYRSPSIPEEEIPMKKFDFMYGRCDASLKEELDKLSDEDKLRYVECTEKVLGRENKNALDNYLHELKNPKKPVGMRVLSKVLIIAFVGFIGFQSYDIYGYVNPIIEEHNEIIKKQKEESNRLLDDQVLYIDGLPPIELRSGGTFKKGFIEDIINNNIKSQPDFLLNNCNLIILADDSHFEKSEDIAGFALSYNMSIQIRVSTYGLQNTISHELSHIFDYANNSISESNQFVELYNAKPISVSIYGATNQTEFFAEAGSMYINEPDTLKTNNIDVFNYFNQLYGPYL